jgi:hypothetical protein
MVANKALALAGVAVYPFVGVLDMLSLFLVEFHVRNVRTL